MGMTYEDAIRDSMAKGAEAAKASAANREKDINGNGMYWYGKALEYKQMHEMAVLREKHLEAELQRRTSELNYRMREADLLAERIRAYDQLEPQFAYLAETKDGHPEAISALQYALGAVKDAKYNFRAGDGVAECHDWKDL